MGRLNNILALSIIGMFCLEFGLLLFADYSNNTGTSKSVALIFYTLTYIWFTFPAIASVLFGKKLLKSKIALTVATLLNGLIFLAGIPMLIDYI
jgi:hypothetical protein